jgi:phosphoglycolate phosphatase
MAIRGILFDKDGVFVDFDKTWAPALKVLARDFSEGDAGQEARYLELAGYDPLRDIFVSGSIWAAGNTADLVNAWLPAGSGREKADMAQRIDGYCATCDPAPLLPLEDLRAVFSSLRGEGYVLGVATNDSEISARNTVARFGLEDVFALVMGYDSVVRPKPAGDPVHLFAAHTGFTVTEVAMVGDNLHDAEMARAAGTGLSIGVLSGNSTRQELEPHVDHVIDSIADVAALMTRVGL